MSQVFKRSGGIEDVHVMRGGIGYDVDEFPLVNNAIHNLTHVFGCEF